VREEYTAGKHRAAENNPAFPAQWAYCLCRMLPGETSSAATVISQIADSHRPVGRSHHHKIWRQHRAPGPNGFAVRELRGRFARWPIAHGIARPAPPFAPTPIASTAFHPAFVTIAIRPSQWD